VIPPRRFVLLGPLVLVAGCARGCGEPAPVSEAPVDVVEPPQAMLYSPACVAEIDRAAVARIPGHGDLDQLVATCAGDTLALWTLRGHTLGRITRTLEPGARFAAPEEVSTGADRLGAVAEDAIAGPLAWRSPTTNLEDERDTLWAAHFAPPSDAGSGRIQRGSLSLPVSVSGLGAPTARSVEGGAVTVLAGFTMAGHTPFVATVSVPLEAPPRAPRAPAAAEPSEPPTAPLPSTQAAGELLAAGPGRDGVSLLRMGSSSDAGTALSLVAAWPDGRRQGIGLDATAGHVLVHPRGISLGSRTAFVLGTFSLGGAGCIPLGPELCVRPGALSVLLLEGPGDAVRRIPVAPAGLPDGLAAQGDTLEVLYVAPDPQTPGDTAQRGASVHLPDGRVTARTLTAPPGMGSLDTPTLVSCRDGVWIAMGVSVPAPDGGGRVMAATALPWSCVAR